MKSLSLIFAFWIFITIYIQANDRFKHTSRIGLSYNLFQAVFDEKTFLLEYKPIQYFCVNAGVGFVTNNERLHVNAFSRSQDENPGLVYDGVTFRANLQYVFIEREFKEFYLGSRYVSKNLHYENMQFYDSEGDHGDHYILRSETAKVRGLDWLAGTKYHIFRSNYLLVSLDLYVGFGSRNKNRMITNHRKWGNNEGSQYDYSEESLEFKLSKKKIPIFGFNLLVSYLFE